MNKYKGTFYFNGEWQFFDFTSDMLANAALEHTDDILDFICENDKQIMEYNFYSKGEERCVGFSPNNPRMVEVAYPYDEEKYGVNSGIIIEKNIPWLLLQVIDNDDNNQEYYNLADNI